MTPAAHPATAVLSPGGRLLPVLPVDRLWLARAVQSEGEPRDLVAQTLVNRWAHLADQRPGLYPTLASLVQAYAQPVNPSWYPTGAKHVAALERGQDTVERAERRRDVHSTRTLFSPETHGAVQRALTGPLTLPVGAVHYSVPRDSAEWQALLLVPGVRGQSNAIYTAAGARNARYSIPSRRPTRGNAGIVAVLLVGGLVAGVAVVTLSKKGRAMVTPDPQERQPSVQFCPQELPRTQEKT